MKIVPDLGILGIHSKTPAIPAFRNTVTLTSIQAHLGPMLCREIAHNHLANLLSGDVFRCQLTPRFQFFQKPDVQNPSWAGCIMYLHY